MYASASSIGSGIPRYNTMRQAFDQYAAGHRIVSDKPPSIIFPPGRWSPGPPSLSSLSPLSILIRIPHCSGASAGWGKFIITFTIEKYDLQGERQRGIMWPALRGSFELSRLNTGTNRRDGTKDPKQLPGSLRLKGVVTDKNLLDTVSTEKCGIWEKYRTWFGFSKFSLKEIGSRNKLRI